MRVHIFLTEELTRLLQSLLLQIGTSDPTDRCECLYVRVEGWLELVFHLFA